jgi:hypothetical protein
MSVISQHKKFIERNGGLGVFRWIMEQDGIENFENAKIYPIIAWNEYHHDDIVVIASAYRHKDFFVIINYEEDFSYLPERIRVWVEEVMDITGFENIVEVFRDNHMIAVYDENMEMMVEWYGENLGVESLINFASYQNNILLDDEIDLDDEDVMDEYEINFNTNLDLNSAFDKLLKEFLKHTTNQNNNYKDGGYFEKEFFNFLPEDYNPYLNNSSYNSKKFTNKTQIWDDKDSAKVKKTNKGFDDEFREKWS